LGQERRAETIRSDYLAKYDIRQDESFPQLILNDEDDPYFRELTIGTVSSPETGSPESHLRLFKARQTIDGWLEKSAPGKSDTECETG
jgi:hypothetical protein